MVYIPRFPKLYNGWLTHDLTKFRPSFYSGLREQDQLVVWQFIEHNYLLRYKRCISVAFEWSAYGLWGIPFPGSVGMGECLSPEDFQMPDPLVVELNAWHSERDKGSQPWEEHDPFDYDASDLRGFAVSKKIKAFLGEAYYVEYHPFQELIICNGDIIQNNVPEFIREICR